MTEGLAPLRAAQHAVETAQETELRIRLERLQAQHVDRFVSAGSLRSAHLNGIGWPAKARLWAAGIRSAADVDAAKLLTIPGLRPKTSAALLAWREKRTADARKTQPQRLPAKQETAIQRRWQRKLDRISREQKRVVAEAAPILRALERTRVAASAADERRLRTIEDRSETRLQALTVEAQRRSAELMDAHQHRDEIVAELETFDHVTAARFLGLVALGSRFDG